MHSIIEKLEQYNDNEYDLKIQGEYDKTVPEKLTVQPVGNIESYNAEIFSKAVLETLKAFTKTIEYITVDLKKVPYMSSTGIGSILQILNYVNQHQMKLKIVNINEKIQETFNLIGFNSFLDIR
ncbi:MAG: STAS domain-containing protein [Spirochaetales bacterium]|nr:STAS domain-containing protein [Spirochaetales bacterium]